jgi:hypothetical protein
VPGRLVIRCERASNIMVKVSDFRVVPPGPESIPLCDEFRAWLKKTCCAPSALGDRYPACHPPTDRCRVGDDRPVSDGWPEFGVFSARTMFRSLINIIRGVQSFHFPLVDAFSERQILKKNRRRCSLVRRGRSAAWGRTVRDLAQGLGFPA